MYPEPTPAILRMPGDIFFKSLPLRCIPFHLSIRFLENLTLLCIYKRKILSLLHTNLIVRSTLPKPMQIISLQKGFSPLQPTTYPNNLCCLWHYYCKEVQAPVCQLLRRNIVFENGGGDELSEIYLDVNECIKKPDCQELVSSCMWCNKEIDCRYRYLLISASLNIERV